MSRWLGLVGPSAGGLAKPCKTVPFTRSFIVKVNSSVELVGLQSVAKKGFFSNKFLTLTKREREKKRIIYPMIFLFVYRDLEFIFKCLVT